MQINITLNGDEGPRELNALAALIASLGGRCPTATPVREVMAGPTIAKMQAAGTLPNALTTSTTTSGAASPSPSTAPTPDVGAPDRDSAGIQWDERIHSASKATVADGTWRRRKNTPDETYDAVMAELRGAVKDPNEQLPAEVMASIPEPSTDDTPPPPEEPAATETTAAAADNASDVPPPPADGPDLSSFPKFVQAVNNKDVPADKKTYGALNELCAAFGVAAFKDMKDRPNDWAMFYDMVG